MKLSDQAQKIVDSYFHFPAEGGVSIPYFNNRRARVRHGLRAQVGKGSIEDIRDEVTLAALRDKVKIESLPATALKEYLVGHNIGIDCSGFAFYVLDAENAARGFGKLSRNLKFPFANNFIKKIVCMLRAAENTGVSAFSHETNSRAIALSDVSPGDFISMTSSDAESRQYNHMVVVSEVESENGALKSLKYVHSIAWPTDGEFNHGVREGRIEIHKPGEPIENQLWIENQKSGEENYTHGRAKKSNTTVRRLVWWK